MSTSFLADLKSITIPRTDASWKRIRGADGCIAKVEAGGLQDKEIAVSCYKTVIPRKNGDERVSNPADNRMRTYANSSLFQINTTGAMGVGVRLCKNRAF